MKRRPHARRAPGKPTVIRSAGAIVFRMRGQRREYLVLHHARGGHWDFPKGKRETGESTLATVRREAREETGLTDLKVIPGFSKRLRWRMTSGGTTAIKHAVYVLARTAGGRIRLSPEHRAARWVSAVEARTLVTYPNARAMLRIADIFLGGPRPSAASRRRAGARRRA